MELKLWRITDFTRLKARKAAFLLFDQPKLRTKHWKIAPCKGIQDSLGFWIPRHDFQIPVTGFRIIFQWIPDSRFHFPRLLISRISDPDSLERGENLSTGCISLLPCALYDGHCIQSTVLSRFEMKIFHQFLQSNPVNTRIEGTIKSVRTNGGSVLSGLNFSRENWCRGLVSPGTKQTVRNNEVSVERGLTIVEFSAPIRKSRQINKKGLGWSRSCAERAKWLNFRVEIVWMHTNTTRFELPRWTDHMKYGHFVKYKIYRLSRPKQWRSMYAVICRSRFPTEEFDS